MKVQRQSVGEMLGMWSPTIHEKPNHAANIPGSKWSYIKKKKLLFPIMLHFNMLCQREPLVFTKLFNNKILNHSSKNA